MSADQIRVNSRSWWIQECLQPCRRRSDAVLTHQRLTMVVLDRDKAARRKTARGDTSVTDQRSHGSSINQNASAEAG